MNQQQAFIEAVEGFAESTRDAIKNMADALEAQEKDLALVMEMLTKTSKIVLDLNQRIEALEKGAPNGNREA